MKATFYPSSVSDNSVETLLTGTNENECESPNDGYTRVRSNGVSVSHEIGFPEGYIPPQYILPPILKLLLLDD